jgi:hypothetical protein
MLEEKELMEKIMVDASKGGSFVEWKGFVN